MTKRRVPLTFDAALARIAGQLPRGWDEMGDRIGATASYLRKCGDPDCREKLAIADAIALDLAYEAAGGEGHPLFDAYGAQLELAEASVFAGQFALLRRVCTLIKEGGEAHAALARLCLPDASEGDRRAAQVELAEAFEEIRQTLPLLDLPVVQPELQVSAGHPQRAPP